MKWIDTILNFVVNTFFPTDRNREKEYEHLKEEQFNLVELPDTPLFNVLNSVLESIQIYMIEPFFHSMERLSLENSTIEILFFWKPFFLNCFDNLIQGYQFCKRKIRKKFYHAFDRRGFTILVENGELERAYELIHYKFHLYFYFIHRDEELKSHPLTVEQREIQNQLEVVHKEAFQYWCFHEVMFRKVYLLVQEINQLQEWILLQSLEINQIDNFLLWKKWSKRKEKLQQSLFNHFFDIHHYEINMVWKKVAPYIGLKELHPYEYLLCDYQFKLERDIRLLSQNELKWNSDWCERKSSLIENEIKVLLHLQSSFFHFLHIDHHPKLLVILSKSSSVKNQISIYIMCKEHIRMWKKKMNDLLMWYLVRLSNEEILNDFFEIWTEVNQELNYLQDQLFISFLKQIKTEENKNKDIQTRVIQTLKNKIVRKSVQGYFFDKTMDLDAFVKIYQERKSWVQERWNDLKNLITFYDQSKNKLNQTSLMEKIGSVQVIENFF